MNASVDKFGRFRGGHSRSRDVAHGPPGVGFVLDSKGNYDMNGKRITNVGLPVVETDALRLQHANYLHTMITHNTTLITEEMPKKFPAYIEGYIENHKKDKIVPLINETIKSYLTDEHLMLKDGMDKLSDVFKNWLQVHKTEEIIPAIREIALEEVRASETKITKEVNKMVDERLEQKKLEIDTLKEEVLQIKSEAQDELKALCEMTRSYIHKITSPGYKRKDDKHESDVLKKLKEKTSTWREAFPELQKKKEGS